MKREIDEVVQELDNLEIAQYAHPQEQIDEISKRIRIEFADCLMYFIDSSRRFGFNIRLFLMKDQYNSIFIDKDLKYYLDSLKEDCDILIKDIDKKLLLLCLKKYLFIWINLLIAAKLNGLSLYDLFIALEEKLEINLKLNCKINEDKSYSHI